jgi:hypothetical protein
MNVLKLKWTTLCLLIPALLVITCSDEDSLGPPKPPVGGAGGQGGDASSDVADEEIITIDGEIPTCLEGAGQ